MAFGWHGEYPLDVCGVFWVVQGGVAEHRVDRGEAPVAGSHRVVPVAFEVFEERHDQSGVEVGDVEGGGRLAGLRARETDQQPERVAVPGDGVAGGAALRDEPVGEEGLEHGCQCGHDRPASYRSRRAATSCMSSGTADKYQ